MLQEKEVNISSITHVTIPNFADRSNISVYSCLWKFASRQTRIEKSTEIETFIGIRPKSVFSKISFLRILSAIPKNTTLHIPNRLTIRPHIMLLKWFRCTIYVHHSVFTRREILQVQIFLMHI